MSNYLDNFNNLYANLAQSAYPDGPRKFPFDKLEPSMQNKLNSGQSIPFDYSQSVTVGKHTTQGGINLPNDGVVYLQPDPTVQLVVSGTGAYQKGDLTDDNAGFNAYFVTDTPTLNAQTKNTYLTIRGSDGASLSSLNDWVYNDGYFALADAHIPQGKLTTAALRSKIASIKKDAPQAILNVTGHSLGTINAVQGLAGLTPDELDQVGQVVLFNGPDTRASLVKMGLTDQQIDQISQKVVYYVNPFDMVSMLNRNTDNPVGTVHIVVPLDFTTAFDRPSSHLFGGFQIGADGQILTASSTYHPYLLDAAKKLADLNGGALYLLKEGNVTDPAQLMLLWKNYQNAYKNIIASAKSDALKWSRDSISQYKSWIRQASGAQKIQLRVELLYTASMLASLEIENRINQIKDYLSKRKLYIEEKVAEAQMRIQNSIVYLDGFEVWNYLSAAQFSNFWDESIEAETLQTLKHFQQEVTDFTETLNESAQRLNEVDSQGAQLFEELLTKYK